MGVVRGSVIEADEFKKVQLHILPMASRQATLACSARNIFLAAVNSVIPSKMMRNCLRVEGQKLIAGQQSYLLDRNVHVVGFGKAVLPMAKAVHDILGEHIVNGSISIPNGALATFKNFANMDLVLPDDCCIKVSEGARNNLPDEDSLNVTKKIMDAVQNLSKDDVLLVLISGGGSALFAAPVPPISLKDKCEVIKLLANAGASIEELNIVRKQMSMVKGGRLAQLAYPAQVVALILSDIVGDPLDQVASGPTFPNIATLEDVLQVLRKYKVQNCLPKSVKEQLTDEVPRAASDEFGHVNNILVGNNSMAVNAACDAAITEGFHPFVLSKSVMGDARHLGETVALFGRAFCIGSENVWYELLERLRLHSVGSVQVGELRRYMADCLVRGKACVVLAGETTVTVTGQGVGGRNQEMVLACGVKLAEMEDVLKSVDCVFLSAGTDGIDGPTTAAGALTFPNQVRQAAEAGMVAEQFLTNNDSHSFFSGLENGEHMIVTGITGTNVMDIQVFIVENVKQGL